MGKLALAYGCMVFHSLLPYYLGEGTYDKGCGLIKELILTLLERSGLLSMN